MSAIMLPRLHIHCLVAAGFLPLPETDAAYGDNEQYKPMQFDFRELGCENLSAKTADKIGQALVDTNLSSIIHRYENAPDLVHENEIKPYQWPDLSEALTTPVETLNAISCYEYQASEHDEWKTSLARRYCAELRAYVCHSVPGFAEGGWTMLASKIEQRRALQLL